MKVEGAEVLPPAVPLSAEKGKSAPWADYITLTKPRILFMVLITTAMGFYMGTRGALELVKLMHTLLGTGLVVGGASALNMFFEHDLDGKMKRTENRPLPAGRLSLFQAQCFGVVLSAAGLLYLFALVDSAVAFLALVSFLNYVFIYTPLKRKSSLCIPVGAISGAIPPLLGWLASGGALDTRAGVLFSILFLWQFPHFLALAWWYRDDFARAGLPMLSVLDAEGTSTARQSVLYTITLMVVSIAPWRLGMAGELYLWGALALGIGFLGFVLAFTAARTAKAAYRVFLASIAYLPLLLTLLAADKI